ncbi:MAG: hypothetical protein MUC41_17810 [Syntrophobacteraceae bacterium]|jgi:hypothetical protein|nr:hypothetical protein [Syntrophobacteraceae bacterium]
MHDLTTSPPRLSAGGAGDRAAARIVIQNALFLGSKKLSGLTIPWVTYTDPEIAHVGMYERDALEKGIEVDTFIRPLSEVDRAVVEGAFSWVGPDWEHDLRCEDATLVTRVRLRNEKLGLAVECRDAVDFHEDVPILRPLRCARYSKDELDGASSPRSVPLHPQSM